MSRVVVDLMARPGEASGDKTLIVRLVDAKRSGETGPPWLPAATAAS